MKRGEAETRRRDETKSKVSGGGGHLVVSSSRRLVVSLSHRLVVSWTGPYNVPKNGVQKFEKYGMDFGPPRYGRLVVSPSRLAVSSRRLVSSSRRLVV